LQVALGFAAGRELLLVLAEVGEDGEYAAVLAGVVGEVEYGEHVADVSFDRLPDRACFARQAAAELILPLRRQWEEALTLCR
jgi:hypothetical protein